MPRLLGVDVPGQKRIEYALCYIYGIGLTRARLIVEEAKIDPAKKADDLTPEELRTVIGIIPGVGEDIGAWVSYAAARRNLQEVEGNMEVPKMPKVD